MPEPAAQATDESSEREEHMKSFEILSGNQRVVATLLEREAPTVTRKFIDSLPCESFSVHAKFAGDELIVMVPFFCESENEIFNVQPGDIGFYPGRQTICIFYGDTEPFGEVSVFAKVTDGLDVLRDWGLQILTHGSIPVQMQAVTR